MSQNPMGCPVILLQIRKGRNATQGHQTQGRELGPATRAPASGVWRWLAHNTLLHSSGLSTQVGSRVAEDDRVEEFGDVEDGHAPRACRATRRWSGWRGQAFGACRLWWAPPHAWPLLECCRLAVRTTGPSTHHPRPPMSKNTVPGNQQPHALQAHCVKKYAWLASSTSQWA